MVINGIEFRVESSTQNEIKSVIITPFPNETENFATAQSILGRDSLNLLWSKQHFGIENRIGMFNVLYASLEELIMKEEKTNDDYLTLQALYCDMIIRLGIILEDFAGICWACREHSINQKDIAEVFLAYSDPIGFYDCVTNRRRNRVIKQIFKFPESKGSLRRIFHELSEEEENIIWNAIVLSTQKISEKMQSISKAIVREERHSLTHYDMYNKLKHGFAPIYPHIIPVDYKFDNVPIETSDEELIRKYMLESITVMHDKLSGQRSEEEQNKYDSFKLATPALTVSHANIDNAVSMLNVVNDIKYLYNFLINRYISYATGSKKISLLLSEGLISEEDYETINSILNDESKYI